ncbi:MAG: hypothetical protein M3Y72_24680 [Acidobacteriota bacterium]|nr:hypothetical protein [Acidobacteriota bacterium]
MSKATLIGIAAALLWIAWCIFVVTQLVPRIRMHVLLWNWLMAYVLCLVPVIIAAFVTILRLRPKS